MGIFESAPRIRCSHTDHSVTRRVGSVKRSRRACPYCGIAASALGGATDLFYWIKALALDIERKQIRQDATDLSVHRIHLITSQVTVPHGYKSHVAVASISTIVV